MKLIVGLGNPGAVYKYNRHNLGFMVVEAMAITRGLSWRYSRDFLGFFAKAVDFVIFKPSTYMNKSGEAVRVAASYSKIEPQDILVVHDELDLDFGKIRLSFEGSGAGHRGVASVIESLASPDFCRLRIGIGSPRLRLGEAGRPVKGSGEDYVLENFEEREKQQLTKIIAKCQEAIGSYVDEGIEATMNSFN